MLPSKCNVNERHIWRLPSVVKVNLTGCIMDCVWCAMEKLCVNCDCEFPIFTYLCLLFCIKLVSSCELNIRFHSFSNRSLLYTDNIVNISHHKPPHIQLIRAVTFTFVMQIEFILKCESRHHHEHKVRSDEMGHRNASSADCFLSNFHFGLQSLTFYT